MIGGSGESGLTTFSVAAAWGVIGSLTGTLAAYLIFKDSDAAQAGGAVSGGLLWALAALGVLRRRRRSPLKELEQDLLEADRLFLTGRITVSEYEQLRASLIARTGSRALR